MLIFSTIEHIVVLSVLLGCFIDLELTSYCSANGVNLGWKRDCGCETCLKTLCFVMSFDAASGLI